MPKSKTDIVIRSRQQWEDYKFTWDEHDWEGDPRRVVNAKFAMRKSVDQNSGYRALIRELAEHIGDDPDSFHRDFLEKYGIFEERESSVTGDTYWTIKSTADYSSQEMSELIEKLIYFAATFCDYTLTLQK